MHYQFLTALALVALWFAYRKKRGGADPVLVAKKHLWKKTFAGTFINGY